MTDDLLDTWSALAESHAQVDPRLYPEYDVKRGLRDHNGRGILAGLTQIGDVVGTATEDDHLVPAPGKLYYRGIEIRDLVNGFVESGQHGFEETTYLLLFGDLPRRDQLAEFEDLLSRFRKLPRTFIHNVILSMPSRDTMNALARAVLALYTLDKQADDISTRNVLRQSLHLIAKFPMLAVYAYQAYLHEFHGKSLVIHQPLPELSTAENFLHMLRPDSSFTELEALVLDMTLVLHAEHGGGNNSSFTTHVVSSTGTDTYSSIAASLGSLKGPRHGGANIKVVQMFEDMKREVKDWNDDDAIADYLHRLLEKQAFDRAGLVYGVGHPVYSVSDPRAEVLKVFAERLAIEKGRTDEFVLHAKVEQIAPLIITAKRNAARGVCANVDFYSGFVYEMLGIPVELYTPLFAVSRVTGWCAHRIEELANSKIIRPAYKSVSPIREYVPIDQR
ncbi:citrate/2-methylcitrate synthase [Coriobacteriia bacterium Es71-Z0120]|uniref:citrate/2-methylcitrate synthase n=1 Tax=Parvivirga hydrogeniphila TaxID=2939460 RepID=UPI002260F6EE|nr:citrate/2-methylcitrate synthase [Parvivirga hydrogeniphila]